MVLPSWLLHQYVHQFIDIFQNLYFSGTVYRGATWEPNPSSSRHSSLHVPSQGGADASHKLAEERPGGAPQREDQDVQQVFHNSETPNMWKAGPGLLSETMTSFLFHLAANWWSPRSSPRTTPSTNAWQRTSRAPYCPWLVSSWSCPRTDPAHPGTSTPRPSPARPSC